jgi:hypothetical protein
MVLNFVCVLDTALVVTMLIILAFRGTCQGLIFSTYVSFWVLEVSKPLNSPQQVLQWMVARAHFKWEELRVAPRPPLSLSIFSKLVTHTTWFSALTKNRRTIAIKDPRLLTQTR